MEIKISKYDTYKIYEPSLIKVPFPLTQNLAFPANFIVASGLLHVEPFDSKTSAITN
jgi:hypothetical protein